jgi:hypothetical protein
MTVRSKYIFTIALIGVSLLFAACSQKQIAVEPTHKPVRELFSLADVRVSDPQMLNIQNLNHQYLLSLDLDRLLVCYRKEAGLPTLGHEQYAGWESEDVWGGGPLSGHMIGFWLSAMAMSYEATGDESVLPKVEYALKSLRECQEAHGDGFLGAQFEELMMGAKAIILNSDEVLFNPIIEVATAYKNAHKEAFLFEYAVGDGKLIVCSLNLDGENPLSLWLKREIENYAAGDSFKPEISITENQLLEILGALVKKSEANTNLAFNKNDVTAN